jgi:hypothetical protein
MFSLSRLEFQGEAHAALRIGRAESAGCYEKRATVPLISGQPWLLFFRWGRARI